MPFDNTTYPETETRTERDLRILRAAREGISKPGGWCRHMVTIPGELARHCAVGWIGAAVGSFEDETLAYAQSLLERDLPKPYKVVTTYNDNIVNQSTVVRLFDRAIARLERERDA
jgi:hypothetical protein